MQGTFWSNTIWYVLLFATTAAVLVVALRRSENRRYLTVVYLAVVGLFYLFEYGLVIVLDAYRYLPMIFPQDRLMDTIMGNMASQTSIAAVCVLIIAFRLRPWWYFVFAAAFYLIEVLFVRLGVFEHNWYRAIYTPVILVPLFWAIRRWYDASVARCRRINEWLLVFFSTLAVSANLVTFPLRILGIQLYSDGLFADPSRDHTATGLPFSICFITLLMFACRAGWRWPWRALTFAGLFAVQYGAFRLGIVSFWPGWFVPVTLFLLAAYTLLIILTGRMARACPADRRL